MAARYHFLSEYTLTSDREAIWARSPRSRSGPHGGDGSNVSTS